VSSRELAPPSRRDRDRDRRRRRRRPVVALAIKVAVLVVLFFAGLAIGRVLDDNPETDRPATFVRTLQPLELEPAPRTVTLTVTTP
jgi:hypothetical protein